MDFFCPVLGRINIRRHPHHARDIKCSVNVHSAPGTFENATVITDRLRFLFEEKSHDHRDVISRFRKDPHLKCFLSTIKRKAGVFKFLRFEERVFVTDECGR